MSIVTRRIKFLLVVSTLFFTACFNDKSEEQRPKKVLLEGNPSEESNSIAQKYFFDGEYEKALEYHLKQLEEDLKYYQEQLRGV